MRRYFVLVLPVLVACGEKIALLSASADGGLVADAGMTADAGSMADAGVTADAGSMADAGPEVPPPGSLLCPTPTTDQSRCLDFDSEPSTHAEQHFGFDSATGILRTASPNTNAGAGILVDSQNGVPSFGSFSVNATSHSGMTIEADLVVEAFTYDSVTVLSFDLGKDCGRPFGLDLQFNDLTEKVVQVQATGSVRSILPLGKPVHVTVHAKVPNYGGIAEEVQLMVTIDGGVLNQTVNVLVPATCKANGFLLQAGVVTAPRIGRARARLDQVRYVFE